MVHLRGFYWCYLTRTGTVYLCIFDFVSCIGQDDARMVWFGGLIALVELMGGDGGAYTLNTMRTVY